MERPGNGIEYITHIWGDDEKILAEISGGEEAAQFEIQMILKDRAEGSRKWRYEKSDRD